MAKSIPAVLLAHKAQAATTLCDLLKVGPLPDGSYVGFTSLDRDVTYDDGSASGAVLYRANPGYSGSTQVSSSDLSVDNSEAQSLSVPFGGVLPGISQEAIDRGYFDKTQFVVYRVNFMDLTMGHEVMASGTIGEQRMKVGGMAVFELRSLSQQFKQTIVELDSITCRATYGSQPIGTGGGVVEERFPCGKTTVWVSGTVTSLGADSTRQFTASGMTQDTDYFKFGAVRFTSGDNAGREVEVESFASGGVFELMFTLPDAIAVGDTFEAHIGCSKIARDTTHGCKSADRWGTEWPLHFRGEPDIPVGDAGALNSPGAGMPMVSSGTGEAWTGAS